MCNSIYLFVDTKTTGLDFEHKVKQKKLSNHNTLVDIKEFVKEFKQYQKILKKYLRTQISFIEFISEVKR